MSALDFASAALQLGVTEAHVRAVDTVESAGAGFGKDGRIKILFEPHKFQRHTKGKFDKTHPNLSHPRDHRNQVSYARNQHEVFHEACALDKDAAIKSCSWGRYQVLGEHYKALGFESPQEFMDQHLISEHQHLMAFCKFIRINPRMHAALKRSDWPVFAECYNGPAYNVNPWNRKTHPRQFAAWVPYDKKLHVSFKSWGGK